MPSEKILAVKQQAVSERTEKITAASAGVIVNYSGITVADDTKLRAELRKANVEYSVIKNTLTGRACEAAGYGDLKKVLEGMTAIAIGTDDPVAPAKILKDYADKIETFELKGGFVDGEVLDKKGVEALAAIPPKPMLVGKCSVRSRSRCMVLHTCFRRRSTRRTAAPRLPRKRNQKHAYTKVVITAL